MARIELPVTQLTVTGVEPPATTAGSSTENNFIAGNDGRIWVEIENSSASTTFKTTFLTPGEDGGVAIEDPAISVEKEKKKVVGPFLPQVFNQSNGQLWLNPENVALKYRVYRLP